jgi:hypothetical protein
MDEPLTPQHFLPHVDKVFHVRSTGHALTLSRVEPGDADWQAREATKQSFNLIFRGEPNNLLPEGLHTVEVEGGSSFDLYIIPVQTPARDRQDYQALFN